MIAKIRDELDNIIIEESPSTDNLSICRPKVKTALTKFNSLLSQMEISKLIQEAKSTSRELDVIPTPN